MAKLTKEQSNPYSTGSGGANFETHVQAAFAVLMLTGNIAPCLPPWPITKIKLQGLYAGFETDDFIVFTKDLLTNTEAKLLAQIKHTISITKSDETFGEVIQAAWNDFNNPKIFSHETDAFALITGPLTATDTHDVRPLLEWARHSENEKEFLSKVYKKGFSSDTKKEKLDVFRKHLQNANDGEQISDQQLWEFLKHFYLLGYDFDSETGSTITFLHSLIDQSSTDDPSSIWAKLVNEVKFINQDAGTLSLYTLSTEILQSFNKRTDFTRVHASGELISLDLVQEIIIKDKKMEGKLHLLNYLPPKSQSTIKQTRIKEAKTKYFEYLSSECGEITLEGLPADRVVVSRRHHLENIFVPIHLEKEYVSYDASGNAHVVREERLTTGKVFSENLQLAILAAPGGGKTTLLKRLAIAYAFPNRRSLIDDDLPEENLLPLFIRCHQLDFVNSSISEIFRSIPKKFEREDLGNEFLYTVNASLQKGNALLLIDGLDEIPDERHRISFVKHLRNFISIYPKIRTVITAREAGLRIIRSLFNFFWLSQILKE